LYLVTRISSLPRKIGNFPNLPGGLEYVKAAADAVGDVDVAAVVDLDIVGHDRGPAAPALGGLHATRLRVPVRRGDVVADLLRIVGIADVHRAHAGVEPGDEHDALVVDGREVLLRLVRAEARAASAEGAVPVRNLEVRDADRVAVVRDVHDQHHLRLLVALVLDRVRQHAPKAESLACGGA